MTGGRIQRVAALCSIFTVLAAACGGGDGSNVDAAAPNIQAGIVVTTPVPTDETSADSIAATSDDEPEVVSTDDVDLANSEPADAASDDEPEEDLEIAEADEDELDSLLNALNVFNKCLSEAGWELDGFPGDGSGRALEDFDQDYLVVLGACNTQSGIADAAASFGDSQDNLSADEIERINFGLPRFKECLEDLGWEVAELIPNERGALGMGESGVEMTPPGGGGLADFNTDDIDECRGEAERYTEENFAEEES